MRNKEKMNKIDSDKETAILARKSQIKRINKQKKRGWLKRGLTPTKISRLVFALLILDIVLWGLTPFLLSQPV
jgi:hypothetical protein